MTPPVLLLLHPYGFRYHFDHAPGWDVFSFIERALADGFAGVAINVNGPGFRWLGGDAPEHVAAVAARVAESGLALDIETSSTDPAHLARLLDLADRLGAAHLRTYTKHRGPRAQVIEATVRDLARAASQAEARGIPILLENHEEFTGVEVARVLAGVGSQHVGALYDYGNSMMVREDPLEALEAMAPYTRSAHLKDHVLVESPDGPLVAGVPIGRGSLPIVELTRRLLAAGVTRIAFENVWSYTCPVRAREDGLAPEPLGVGTFAYLQPPFDAAVFLPDADALAGSDPARVLALEQAAHEGSLAWLRAALAAATIGVAGSPGRS